MKTKFLLPVLAMIVAIGMSFTTLDSASDPDTDYILQNGTFQRIGMELDCNPGSESCKVQFEPNGAIHEVYDAADPNTLKEGSGEVIRLWE